MRRRASGASRGARQRANACGPGIPAHSERARRAGASEKYGLRVQCRPGDAARERARLPRRARSDQLRPRCTTTRAERPTRCGRGSPRSAQPGCWCPRPTAAPAAAWSTWRSCSKSSAARCIPDRSRRARSARWGSCSPPDRPTTTRHCCPAWPPASRSPPSRSSNQVGASSGVRQRRVPSPMAPLGASTARRCTCPMPPAPTPSS